MMRFILGGMPYKYKGKKSLDYIIYCYKKIIQISFVGTLLGLVGVGLFYLFRVQLPFAAFVIFFALFHLIAHFNLFIGLWHTHLISRQRYKLFAEPAAFPRVERIRQSKLYRRGSFVVAILASAVLILLTTNNYISSVVNAHYDQAETFIKYQSDILNYKTLHLLTGNVIVNNLLLVLPAFIMIILYWNAYKTNIKPYKDFMDQWDESRYFKDKVINNLVQDRETEGIATITMGIDSVNRDDVVMNVDTRQLNTVGFGLIGTGKSASIAEPYILSDLKNMIAYIRRYASYVEQVEKDLSEEVFESEIEHERALKERLEEWYSKGIGRNYTNGIYLNEPSGSMIDHISTYVKRIGLPEEVIWLVNPLDPKTEAINILTGDLAQAAGLTADLFRNFSDENGGGSSFFLSSEEAHTRNIVTLIKYTSLIAEAPLNSRLKGNPPTLSEFNEVLRSSAFIKARLAIFAQMVKRQKRIYDEIKEEYELVWQEEYKKWMGQKVENYSSLSPDEQRRYDGEIGWRFNSHMPKALEEKYQEERDAFSDYDIMQGTLDYFVESRSINDRTGEEFYTFDANIQGLKAVLRRLSSNKQIRRVFFSQAKRDIDIFLKTGGVILVNSAKSELGDSAAKMVAQVAEIVVQSAVFRRRTDSLDPYFPLYGDEKNTYLIPGKDQSFLDQNRKFKCPVLHLYQNYEQVENTLGVAGAKAIFESYRNAFVFQQASKGAVDLINRRGGSKKVLLESNRRSDDNLLSGIQNNSSAITESIEEQESLTYTDVKRLEQFEFAGVMVIDNEVSDVIRVTSKPIFLFEEASSDDYEPLFNMNNEEDYKSYHIWQNQIEKYYRQKGKSEFLTEKDFRPEEWEIIMSIMPPSVDGDSVDDTYGKGEYAPERPNYSKSAAEKRESFSKKQLTEKAPETKEVEVKKEEPISLFDAMQPSEQEGVVAQNIHEDDEDMFKF